MEKLFTEDAILKSSLRWSCFQHCNGVMYGFVGGHQVIACELYDSPQTFQLIYAPYSNMFLLKDSKCALPCKLYYPAIQLEVKITDKFNFNTMNL